MGDGALTRNQQTAVFVSAIWLSLALPASAQPIYRGFNFGVEYDLYIEDKESLGNDRWRFRTRAKPDNNAPDHVSKWRIADCKNGTINAMVVPKVAEYGYQRGAPEVYKAICGEEATAQPKYTPSRCLRNWKDDYSEICSHMNML